MISAMSSECDALARLFRDDDPETLGLVKEQLIIRGESIVPELRDLVNADSAIVSAHAQDVLHSIAGRKASNDLESLLPGDDLPLEKICWLVSSALMPWVDTEECLSRLDQWGAELSTRLLHMEERGGDAGTVALMTDYLHTTLGFDGNSEDYYNHENSLLPTVMDNRMGLPLTLTLLYRFVANRAGLQVEGVNLPGHFIARLGGVYFDPFHAGRILTIDDCADILSRQGMELSDEHLETPGSREVIARMLANLTHAYGVEECVWQKGLTERWLGLVTGAEQ
jgi:hypothetical protein